HSISLVLPELSFAGGEFFQEIIRGIDNVVEKNNFTLLFSKYAEAENSFYRIMNENRIDGALVLGDIFTVKELEVMDAFNIPIVIVNYRIQKQMKNLIDVFSDNERGGELVAEHLILHHGKRKILFLGGGDKYQANILRLKGLMNVAEKHGVPVQVINGKFETGFRDGQEIIGRLIREKKMEYDAVFAASDSLGVGVLNALMQYQIKVPEDVILVSYDNTQITNFYPITISSVEQNAYLMGVKATDILLSKILKKEASAPLSGIKVGPELVIRHSCGCKI
ncbi:MAG: substrate-binding domain-containing protein, partial [bacterium]|nr:substrate-binding domain-containing protein [bacterium]